MNTFLWVMFFIFALDLFSRLYQVGVRGLPEKTWAIYAWDGAINLCFLCWVIYLLAAK